MQVKNYIQNKIQTISSIQNHLNYLKFNNKKIVFTNGCFDVLHSGHIQILTESANFGDYLIVGLNSDISVKKLKGENRPINNQQNRALLLANLIIVDAIIIFEEETPLELIKAIEPNFLVKGGDYTIETIVGANEVMKNGGTIEIVPILNGYSSTSIIAKM